MNGVATITISGQTVRLKFGLPSLKQIAGKMAEFEFFDGNAYSDMGLTNILYAGYINACMQRDEVPALPFESFYDYVEDFRVDFTNQAEVQAAMKSFEESRFVSKYTPKAAGSAEVEETEDEKKSQLTGTESSLSSSENLATDQ